MSRSQSIPLQYRLAGMLARKSLQRFWEGLYLISMRGLGYNNYLSPINGEDRFTREWLRTSKMKHLVVFDVGANRGDFTDYFSSHALVACDFYLFEPNSKTFTDLKARFEGKSNIRLEQKGVGEKSGRLPLYDVQGSAGTEWASFLPESITKLVGAEAESSYADIVTLDDYCSAKGVDKIDFLKIDTEGFEKQVLEGSRRLIASHGVGTIQLEWNDHNVFSAFSIYQLSEMLPGFEIYRLLPNGVAAVATRNHRYRTRFDVARYCNLVCIDPQYERANPEGTMQSGS